ncbi:MAG: BTAD domain-containing putative transcriptional regulator [bacterium]|jgi:DNA-binding SARP family transcriptional activator|nr:diguanylate cyclase [Bacillota bacterium]
MVKSYQVPDGTANVELSSRDTDLVDIMTLGSFDILCQGESLLAAHERSYKILELLRYLITFRNRRLLPETIIDDLWHNGDSADPNGVLRTQVYRLRKLIEKMQVSTNCQQKPWLELTYANGYYLLEIGTNCQLDIDAFEQKAKYADTLAKENALPAIDLYKQALALYKGLYMAGPEHSEWLLPSQNRYHRLYLKALFRMLELLSTNEAHEEILEVYEKAALIEPYDETLHLYSLQALIGLGETKSALNHYNYITSFLYKELGVKPSAPLRALYRQLQRAMQDNHETDLILIEKNLTDEDDMAGALCCDIDYFRFLCQLEKRRSLRTEEADFLGLITISGCRQGLAGKETQAAMETLTRLLQSSLRKGDVFARWNDNQLLILLTLRQRENLNAVTRRLRSQLQELTNQGKVNIEMRFQPLTQTDSFFG